MKRTDQGARNAFLELQLQGTHNGREIPVQQLKT